MSFASALHLPRALNLRETLAQLAKTIAQHTARRAEFYRVQRELEALSDRDLADLGISRYSIRAIAQQAAYGA